MKINHIIQGHTNIAAGSDQKKVDKSVSTKPEAVEKGDHVHISTLSTHTQDGNSQVIEAAKVAEIKLAISEGRFKVNPEVVADRLLETVKELIRNK